ncbi:hypothetical protein DCO17_04990 [Polynucleobacter tropicus]|uniref:Lipoprotein n=1 Tax=Polynucleobacter tropicus TaxID=1743174 RepID=A0A6M9Q398_9BURK|nr:hypothetical protein [Polynucleobacter tropicus]QKM64646.1 hypothetical protein DCO17_04990 [Polynucleobacter tropicus]
MIKILLLWCVLVLIGCSSISNPGSLADDIGIQNNYGKPVFFSRCLYAVAPIEDTSYKFNRGLCAIYSSQKFIFLGEARRILGVWETVPQSTTPQEYSMSECKSVALAKPNWLGVKQFQCSLKQSKTVDSLYKISVMMRPDSDMPIGFSNDKTQIYFEKFLNAGVAQGKESEYVNIYNEDNGYYYIPSYGK